MDTFAETRPLSLELKTQSVRRSVLVAIYSNDTVVEVTLPYIRPVFVPHYVPFSKDPDLVDTVYVIEGHGRKIIPPIHSCLYGNGKDDEGDDGHVAPLPRPHLESASHSSKPLIVASSQSAVTTHPAIIGKIAAAPPARNEPFDRESAIACIRTYLRASRAHKPSHVRTFEAFQLLYYLTGKNVAQISKLVNYPTENGWTVLKQFEQLVHLLPEGWKLCELAELADHRLSLGWLRDTAQLTRDMQILAIRGKARKLNIRL